MKTHSDSKHTTQGCLGNNNAVQLALLKLFKGILKWASNNIEEPSSSHCLEYVKDKPEVQANATTLS